jgi:uncharacterized protein YhaN
MSKKNTRAKVETTTAAVAEAPVTVKAPSRYEVHYARLRELQAERKAFKAKIDEKIRAAQQEYREYLEKYEAARKESEERFYAAAKPKVAAEPAAEEVSKSAE